MKSPPLKTQLLLLIALFLAGTAGFYCARGDWLNMCGFSAAALLCIVHSFGHVRSWYVIH